MVGARAEFLNGMDLLVFRNQFGASDLSSKLQSSPQEQAASDTIWIPCLIEALGQCGATTTETEGISKIRPLQNLRVSSPENASLKSLEFRQ